jgi:hypothetical protein
MVSSLIGKQAIVVGAGMGGLAAAGAIAGTSSRWSCWSGTHCLQSRRTAREFLRGSTPRTADQRPARAQRALPDFEQDLVRAAPYPSLPVSTCTGRTPATIRSRDATLAWAHTPCHGLPSSMRCDGAWQASRTSGSPALSRRGIAGDTGWRDGYGRPLRQREPLEGNVGGRSRHRRLRRGALTLALLKSIGRPLPEETTIGIDLGYATCVFAIPTMPRRIGKAS